MHRRKPVWALFFVVAACTTPEPQEPPAADEAGATDRLAAYQGSSADEAGALEAVQQLFDALATGDEALLRSVMDPSVVMHFSETRDGATTFGSATLDGLAERITSSAEPLIERMWDPVVLVNGPLATVWTPYDFYAGSALSHCGVDAVNVMNTEDGWRIVALSWTRMQPPECDLHPEGPPSN